MLWKATVKTSKDQAGLKNVKVIEVIRPTERDAIRVATMKARGRHILSTQTMQVEEQSRVINSLEELSKLVPA